jgi:NTP pyrophosphatase (non-canonical NTP hydrolase)
MRVQDLVRDSHGLALQKGWYDGASITREAIMMRLMLAVSELAEAAEEVRVQEVEDLPRVFYGDNNKPEGFAVEIADTVIRIADLCGWLGIDLERAIEIKDAYNTKRPRKHGKHV